MYVKYGFAGFPKCRAGCSTYAPASRNVEYAAVPPVSIGVLPAFCMALLPE